MPTPRLNSIFSAQSQSLRTDKKTTWGVCSEVRRTHTRRENVTSLRVRSVKRMTALTLHVSGHAALFPIRSRESQGVSLDFGQHVSAARLSWRLRTDRRDTWMWEANVPHRHTSECPTSPFPSLTFWLSAFLLSNHARNKVRDSDGLPELDGLQRRRMSDSA